MKDPNLVGTVTYFAALDSTPVQIDSREKLAEFQSYVAAASAEHNRLLRYAKGLSQHPETLNLVGVMAEAWGNLATALFAKHDELKASIK